MFKIILSLGLTLLFAFAQTCNFNDEKQSECEIDIKNPPLMLHKFVNDDGSEFGEYQACVNDGDVEIDDERYEVLDCSNVNSKGGNLTEGVTINNGKNLIKNKIITIKQDNVLLRVAGDFVLESGIRFNTKNPKNFIVEMIEGTNTKSNMILQRGASLMANALIMPEGKNSSVFLNTFYGGIYEKEFIDFINQKSAKSRGGLETLLTIEDIFALSEDGDIVDFNGNIACGPQKNPLDLSDTSYVFKRLFRVKNTSIDAPDNNNAICDVNEGECFKNLIDFSNRKIDGKSYKIATANANIIPTYEIFIESGKIISSDNRTLKDIAPKAKIIEQHYGKCEVPTKIAFDKAVIDEYLADLEAKKALQLAQSTKTQNLAESTKDSTQDSQDSTQNVESTQVESNTQSATQSQNLAESSGDSAKGDSAIKNENSAQAKLDDSTQTVASAQAKEIAQIETSDSANDEIDANENEENSPISAELNAELNENLQDLLASFNSEKIVDSSEAKIEAKKEAQIEQTPQKAESSVESQKDIDVVKNVLTKKDELEINDDFLIVEKAVYEKFNKECYGDLQCLYNSLLPYDKVVWTKKSSKNATNSLYVINVANDNLAVNCEVKNHYGKNIKQSFQLSSTNIIGVLDMKFPTSSNKTQVVCKANKETKSTNKIIVTPASFDMKYSFENEGSQTIPTLKAGTITMLFKQGSARTLEGDIDVGFDENLAIKNISFTQKNKCSGNASENISVPKDLKLNFKKGYLRTGSVDIVANTIAFGELNIDFAIANNDKTCTNDKNALATQCTLVNINEEISIIPDNFRIKTDIISTSNKISYYGQIDDKGTFKYNPMLSIEIEALGNNGKPIDINKTCNYGSIELSLKNDKLIEFKRTSSDRINSKIIVYLSDFEKPTGTQVKAYFGINKLVDSYKRARKMAQNDLLEPVEITLFDFLFDVRFKNGKSQFDYENPEVYDRLDDNSNPASVLIARGKLQTSDIKGDTQDSASLVAKYAIYCKTCDRKMLAKYLQGEPEAESQYWYINNQHPSSFYVGDDFIKVPLHSKDKVDIANSNNALEGRQKILFGSDDGGIYNISIAQRSAEFAPYLNYSDKYKNTYIPNEFSVMISESTKDIFQNIEEVKQEAPKEPQKAAVEVKPKQPSTKPVSKPAKKATSGNVTLDIEE